MIKFSIVIPVFNSSNTIITVLESVKEQVYQPNEVIIIDDKSTDNSLELINCFINQNLHINWVIIPLKKNKGVSYCRNLGLNKSTGDYIAFLDSDDVWHKNKLKMFSCIIQEYNPFLLGHRYSDKNIKISDPFYKASKLYKISIFKLLIRNVFQTSCVVIKNNNRYFFDEAMSFCEDYDLFLNITHFENSSFFYDEVLTKLGRPQLTKGGLSEKKVKMRFGEISAITKILKLKKLTLLIPLFFIFSWIKYLLKILR